MAQISARNEGFLADTSYDLGVVYAEGVLRFPVPQFGRVHVQFHGSVPVREYALTLLVHASKHEVRVAIPLFGRSFVPCSGLPEIRLDPVTTLIEKSGRVRAVRAAGPVRPPGGTT